MVSYVVQTDSAIVIKTIFERNNFMYPSMNQVTIQFLSPKLFIILAFTPF